MVKVLFALTLAFVSLGAHAQSLWKESRYGMSPMEVEKQFPAAVKPTKASSLHNGAIELLHIPNVEIVGHNFNAAFYFKDERLDQVTLSLADKATSHEAKLIYESLAEVLRAKYGKELSNEVGHGIMETLDTTWLSNRTNVTLYYNAIGAFDPILNLVYQVRISTEADKI